MWAGNQRWMTLQGTWSIIVAHSVLLIPYWKPSLLKPPCLNCCYIGVQLYIAFWISPWNATFDDMFVLELLGFALGSVPAAVMATNALVLLLGWFPVCGVVLLRVSTETDFAVAQPDTVVNPRTLIFINILFTGVLFVAYKLSTKLLQNSVESAIRENDSNSHRSAASSLLVLTCDAVCEIDSELKLLSHSNTLATMLLRQTGASLEGRKFTDFIAPGEANRAEELLLTPRDDGAAYAFHTHLVDSCSSKFRTEVFQVKYAMMDGQECHLLGLRDFTDIKSLAGDNAADAIREGHSPHDDDWPPPTLGELDISGNADSRLSYQLGNFSSDASEASNETLEQHNHSNGIVEKRLMYAQKDAFLQIDMETETVDLASAPFENLIGKPISDSFASDFTKILLQRLCEHATRFRSEHHKLPDQVATFTSMPIHVKDSLLTASGVMKVALTPFDRLKIIMRINQAEVTALVPNIRSPTAPLQL